jgi:hypothetical protein
MLAMISALLAFAKATPDDAEENSMLVYHDGQAWKRLQRRAMLRDLSWKRSAQRYLKLDAALLGRTRRRIDERSPTPDDCSPLRKTRPGLVRQSVGYQLRTEMTR